VITHLAMICAVALIWSAPIAGFAGTPGKVDLEAAEMTSALIGAPVYAEDGIEVGTVADIVFDEELQPRRMRMTTDKALGFGTRILDVPKGAFMPVQGAVMLQVPAEAVSTFAEWAEPFAEQ
jgi:PRC-barrel domain